jgi:hypothetical protein
MKKTSRLKPNAEAKGKAPKLSATITTREANEHLRAVVTAKLAAVVFNGFKANEYLLQSKYDEARECLSRMDEARTSAERLVDEIKG